MENSASANGLVAIPGVRLAYEMAGAGWAVVFLHGGLLDTRQWDAQFAHFAKKLSPDPL